MTAFKLQVKDQSLHIIENPQTPQTNDQIVQETLKQLHELNQAGHLTGGELLKIYGRHTLPMAYVISHQLSHVYGAIAVFDPKLPAYVVTISHSPNHRVGDRIP